MRALIIVYEFQNSLINNRRIFEDRIRQYERYAFITRNAAIIFTDATTISVRDYLNAVISSDDKIYVGETHAPAAWNNIPNESSEYIKRNLR